MEKPFKNIQIMVLTIGFPHSGSSLTGYLLTAHPNIVMADEPYLGVDVGPIDHLAKAVINITKLGSIDCLYSADLKDMFDVILSVDYARLLMALMKSRTATREAYIATGNRQNRYILLPNQYQGHFKPLKVIGVKRSEFNALCLSKNNMLENLKKKLEDEKIRLKFILTIRNPYDIISTTVRINTKNKRFFPLRINRRYDIISAVVRAITQVFYNPNASDKGEQIKNAIKRTIDICEYNRITEKIDPQDIFISKNEDMITNPRQQLAKLCDFLEVSAPSDYLNDCASVVIKKPHKSRFAFEWTQEQKQEVVTSLIGKYDFFSGYNWES